MMLFCLKDLREDVGVEGLDYVGHHGVHGWGLVEEISA